MKQGPNPFFQSIISNRIESVINESIKLGYLNHPLLKGKYREFGLGKLLLELLPIGYELGSGIIQDCNGKQSREIDLIIWNKSMLPPLLFAETSGVYPVESCFFTIEVKSKLTNEELSKSIENAKSIIELEYLSNYEGTIKRHPSRTLFSYDSDLKEKSELERYRNFDPNWDTNPTYDCICVIGKGCYGFTKDKHSGKNAWLWFKPNDSYYEVLGLLAGIINKMAGNFAPRYGYYLLHPEHQKDFGEIILCESYGV